MIDVYHTTLAHTTDTIINRVHGIAREQGAPEVIKTTSFLPLDADVRF